MISREFLFSIYKNALTPAIPSSLHGSLSYIFQNLFLRAMFWVLWAIHREGRTSIMFNGWILMHCLN